MFDIPNDEDQTSRADQSLQEIEESLKVRGSEEIFHKFRSFLFLNPNGRASDWKIFNTQPVFVSFAKVLDALPVCTITILCRRHFSELPCFLHFFDSSPAVQMQPKSYLPYLCHKISNIPIQWVVHHILKISDIRYAYQFLTAAFKDGVTMNSNQYLTMEKQNKLWLQYLSISENTPDMSVRESWEKLTYYRSLMKQLLDFKLSISLSDFRRFDKKEFVKRQLTCCNAPVRYGNLLRNSIISFARSNSIDLPQIIIPTLSHRDWPVPQKLSIIKEFIQDKEQLKKALTLMSFRSEEDLDAIRTFAKARGIHYEPLPDNYIEAMNNAPNKRLNLISRTRSCSIGFLDSASNDSYFESPGSTPSIFKSSLNLAGSLQTASRPLAELANGSPEDPKEYVTKLKDFFNLKEIAPIVALARYGVVVSYEQYMNIESHKEILKALIQNNGYQHLTLFCEILNLTDDDIISTLCTDKMASNGEFFIPIIIQYVRRSNTFTFISFIEKVVDSIAANSDPSKACDCWFNWMNSVLDCIDADTIESMTSKALMMNALSRVTSSNKQKMPLYTFIKENENENEKFASKLIDLKFDLLAEIANPTDISKFSQTSFVGGFTSNDLLSFFTSLFRIKKLPKEKIIEYVVAAIPTVKGQLYSRILILYNILKSQRMNYSTEIAVLQILYYSSNHSIDFHELNKNPEEVLKSEVNQENIWDLLPLEKLYKLRRDVLLLEVMLNKMNSSSYEDYKIYIAHLDYKKSIEPLLQKIPERFNSKEKIQFYQGIGCVDIKKKEQTEYDLRCYALNEYIKRDFLQNPSKLILELYSKLALHERLGETLHSLCASIANRYDIQINRICENLLEHWLNENIKTMKKENEQDVTNMPEFSIYIQTLEEICERDDETNIQKVLFILRTWKPRNAAKWLIRFILQTDPKVSYRARLKAIICLFVIADKSLICDVYISGNFESLINMNYSLYYASRLELFGLHYELDDFSPETVKSTVIRSLDVDPGALRTILELCIENKISDRDLLYKILSNLVVTRKRFLLRTFTRFFQTFPNLKYDEEFVRFYTLVISAPINEMICQQVKTRMKPHHMAVIRDLFDSIADETIIVDSLIIDGEKISWAEVISRICSSGMTAFAADLGAHLVGNETRKQALLQLLNSDKYDDALWAGFDKEMVFNFIVENDLTANATDMLVDEHFVLFTAWLKKYHHNDEIEKVKDALRKQGRTKEITRMESRLARQPS